MRARSPSRRKPTTAHSTCQFETLAPASPLPIRPTCFRSFSRPTTPSPARRAAPAWDWPFPSGSLRCTAANYGSSRNLAKARHLPSSFRSFSSDRGTRQRERSPWVTPRRTRNVCNSGIADPEREASQTRFHLHVRVSVSAGVAADGNGMSKRILVVEDQPDNRQIIRDMLAPTDYEITEAENGEQALTAIAK